MIFLLAALAVFICSYGGTTIAANVMAAIERSGVAVNIFNQIRSRGLQRMKKSVEVRVAFFIGCAGCLHFPLLEVRTIAANVISV